MDILNQISSQIQKLSVGEQWEITAQSLLMSRNDFQSISIYLSREAEKGQFSIQTSPEFAHRLGATSLTIVKH